MDTFHRSVLLKETIELLQINKGKRYIDATLGGGGHTFEILRLGGEVLGIDLDEEALEFTASKWKKISKDWGIEEKKLVLIKGNFREIGEIALLNGFENVSGIIFDLGVSAHQLESPERGFSYLREGPLDMRMGKSQVVKASDLVNILTKGELYEIFSRLGQEHRARTISDSIIRSRRIKPIQTTAELAAVVEGALGLRSEGLSSFMRAQANKKVFQGLRIAVNQELESIQEALSKVPKILGEKGRVAIISFHSLEDRIVKQSFIEFQNKNLGKIITKKPIIPGVEEIKTNRKSRSAKLRIFEKN